jgi:hypothetical protein
VDTAITSRRLAMPVALLAAITIAAGGGSSPWSVRPQAPTPVVHPRLAPAVVRLEQIGLAASRTTLEGQSLGDRLDARLTESIGLGIVSAGVAAVVTQLDVAPASPTTPGPATPAQYPYTGTNHVWIPSLGISRSVHAFPCSRSRKPDNLVYRWGCAGRNNVYLMGHAYGVFKPLHTAYLHGDLYVGMRAYYADAKGHVTAYEVTQWRVVDPSDSRWAIADQPVPSMTLQTCIGDLRINVRLLIVGS